MMDFSALTHPGLHRDHNEDTYLADPKLGLFLVADGVGGHASGEVASAIVRETVTSAFSAGSTILNAIMKAHQAILEEITVRESSNMGSTIVALGLEGYDYEIAWVGDSRAYLFDDHLMQLTQDHNTVSELLSRGILTPTEAASHPLRHTLTQSLGIDPNMKIIPGHKRGRLTPGQQLLLCSDGLTDELADEEIARILGSQKKLVEKVNAFIDRALQSGGKDNITAMVIKLK